MTYPPSPQLTYYKWLVVDMKFFWHIVYATLMSFNFYFLIFLYIFQLNGVFIDKVL